MPSNYSHMEFAKAVLSQLDTSLIHSITPEIDEYLVGSFGPDILFFYPPVFLSKYAKVGCEIHDRPAYEPLERLRPLVGRGVPFAKSYAAGFICHFALDNECHKFVSSAAKKAGLSHLGLETEFDRYLMEKNGVDPLHFKPLNTLDVNQTLFCTLKGLYPFTQRELASCYRHQKSMSNLLISCGGGPLSPVVNAFGGIKGTVMAKSARPSCAEACAQFDEAFKKTVPTAAFLVDSYMLSVKTNAPLDSMFNGAFSG